MTFTPIAPTEVDPKSPIDDTLMGKIKDDLDDLDARAIAAGSTPFWFSLTGQLKYIKNYKRAVDYGILNKAFIPTKCRYMLRKSGLTGNLSFDFRIHSYPAVPITGIEHQFSAATSSIAKTGASLNTQSVARSTTQISTQTITFAKASLNVQSIINVGPGLWQYNLNSALDSDTMIDDFIVTASCTAGANNGTFKIYEVGRSGGANFVVFNSAGVAQTAAAGTAQPTIMSYDFSNPVSTEFAAGEKALFASHTSANNDGSLTIFKINQGGNNIWVKNASGVTQGSPAGSADCNRWKFALTSAASTTDYVVGETALTASHTSANNDGSFPITAVNLGGNNVVLYNANGVVQGGVAGTVNTDRWTYTLPSDPSADITAGDTVYLFGHTNAANDGVFPVKEVNRPATNNVVIYNPSGVAQGGSAGNTYTTKKLVKFASDQSANFSTSSYIEMQGCENWRYNYDGDIAPFKVLQVNRGGGANYNVVIDNPKAPMQASPAGYVQVEMKSIFSAVPVLASNVTGREPNQNIKGSSTALLANTIADNTVIQLYLLEVPTGDPQDLSISLL